MGAFDTRNASTSQKSTSAGSDYPTSTDDSGGDVGDDSEAELESMRVTRKSAKAFGYTMGIRNSSLNVLEKVESHRTLPTPRTSKF